MHTDACCRVVYSFDCVQNERTVFHNKFYWLVYGYRIKSPIDDSLPGFDFHLASNGIPGGTRSMKGWTSTAQDEDRTGHATRCTSTLTALKRHLPGLAGGKDPSGVDGGLCQLKRNVKALDDHVGRISVAHCCDVCWK